MLCGRLEAHHDGWISLAFSRTPGMIGAEAIIALPYADTVLKYNMFGYDEVVPMSDERQTLTNTYIEEEEDGRAIMGFTKFLVEDGEIPIEEEGANIFLYAGTNAHAIANDRGAFDRRAYLHTHLRGSHPARPPPVLP